MRFITLTMASLLLSGLFTSAFGTDTKPMALQDALSRGFVQISINGLGDHRGACIQMAITGLHRRELQLTIPAGLTLLPEDVSSQSMIVSQDTVVTLTGQVARKVNLYALCIEQYGETPELGETFTIGTMADGNLLEVVQFISEKHYQTAAAQHGVWCITDSAEISGIYDEENSELSKALGLLVAKLTGKSLPWYQVEYKIEPGAEETFEPVCIHANFQYKLSEDGIVTFGIYNERGDTVHTLLASHAERAGVHSMRIRFESRDLPKGKYFARVTNSGILVQEKVIES